MENSMNEENQNIMSGDGDEKIARPQKIYLKDVSFESPNSPEIFTQDWKPNLEVEIDSHAQQVAVDTYDVVMKVTAKVTTEQNTAFLAEVQQAGIFLIKGFEPDRLRRVQNVFCLRTLYPYASAALSDLVTKGGFPSFLLQPMNFAAIYDQRLQQQEQSTSGEAGTTQH
jgi:preprotein translocase subunit SecB